MPPTPITLLENGLTSTSIFRSGWDVGQQDHHVDPKVVGSHLPLGKRNSTPVGMSNSTSGHHHHHHHHHPYNPLKVAGAAAHLGSAPNPMVTAPSVVGGESGPVGTNPHRSLDRCHSEPVKTVGGPQQQPSPGAGVTSSSRYKTELCRPFAETGLCKYGEKCQFAHGGAELRNMPRHPKYKTEPCRTFHTTGLCGYGTRCHFIHNAEERRNPSSLAFGPGPTGLRSPSEDSSTTELTPPLPPNLSPPASLHGSPTSSAGAFFGDTFSLMTPPHGGGGLGCSPHEDSTNPFSLLSLETLETPPVSPVESLSGDIENLSLSPTLSDSPSPPMPPSHHHSAATLSALLDGTRYLRLPIFESLKETM